MTDHGKELLKARNLIAANTEILKEHGITLVGFLVLDLMCGTGDPEMVKDVSHAEVGFDLFLSSTEARCHVLKLYEGGFVEIAFNPGKPPRYGPSPKGEKVYREALKDVTG